MKKAPLLFLLFLPVLCLGLAVTVLAAEPGQLDFTVDEGTWMSLDVSPDGETLVFELLGDVYRLPVSGGPAQPLLTGPAFQSQPRFSPDGRKLVFISDESGSDNVWVADADGSNARAVSDLPRALMWSPEWSADGKSVYVSVTPGKSPRVAEIWRYDLEDKSGERVVENGNGPPAFLVSAPAPGAYGPVVSADGSSLFYTSVTPRPYGSRTGGSSKIERLDLTTGQSVEVLAEGVNPMKPALTSDGELLVYAAESQGKTGLRVRKLATGEELWLRHPIQRHQLEGRATRDVLPNFSISPDDRFVFAAFGGQIHRLGLIDGSDAVVPFEAKVSLEIQQTLDFPRRLHEGPVRARRLQQPSFGPNGQIAFSALARIYVADSRGAEPRRLTATERPREFMPTWSPDGSRVAFVTWSEDGGHLWLAAASAHTGAREPIRLTAEPGLFIDPVFTPDGKGLLALSAPMGSADGWRSQFPAGGAPAGVALVELSLAGPQEPRVVMADATGLRHPHFASPSEDQRIYFSSTGSLVTVSRRGDDRRVEVASPRQLGPTSWRIHPSGKEVLVRAGDRLLRFDLPEAGSEPTPHELNPEDGSPIASGGDAGFAWTDDGSVAWFRGRHLVVSNAAEGTVDEWELRVEEDPARPSGVVVLRGGKVITMRGDEIVADADLVIEDHRIRSVAERESQPLPADARIIDIGGKVVVPGFIDVHAHSASPLELLEPESAMGFANLSFGVTSLRNPQSPPSIFALADVVEVDGAPSPRIFSTGPGIELSPFAGGGNYLAPSFGSLDEVREILRRYRDEYGTHLLKSYLFGNRQQRQWVVQASRELGMMPTTEGGADTKANMTHAIDGFSGNEHAFPIAPIHDDLVQLIARSGIAYAPTLVVSFGAALPVYRLLAEKRPHLDPRYSRWYDSDKLYAQTQSRVLWFPPEAYNDRDVAQGAREILEAGGRVTLGGHGEAQGLSNHWEMELLAGGGMKPHDVLRVATIFGAEALGYAQDLGSLEPGKLADLVVLDRDPLEDIRNTTAIHYVMKNGVLYDSMTLDQVWPEARPLERPWWLERAAGKASGSDDSSLETTTFESRVDRLVHATMASTKTPGAAVAVVRGKEVLLAKGYGVAVLENQVPVTPRTIFQSGSVGKQFTAAGIMALVEDGRVDLDESVRTYLADTPDDWQPITLRHLLTHSSGIPDYTGDTFDYRKDYTETDLVRMAAELALEFESGSRFNYSNTGYVLLGIVMSEVTGRPYWEFLAERIFRPAGMDTIRVITEADVVAHRAKGYRVGPDGWQNADWVAPRLNTTADGSMLLSLEDMIAWNETVRERRLLSEESWRLILSPMTLNSGRSYPYGFAWFIEERRGRQVHQHSGAWQGFITQFSRFLGGDSEDQDLAVIVLTNARTMAAPAIADGIAGLVDPELSPPPPLSTPIEDPAPEATRYVSEMLEKAAAGDLELSDFAFIRQTVFPRLEAALTRALAGTGKPDRLELLERERTGDDWDLEYFAWYGERRFRVAATLAPEGGLTWLRVTEESP